MRIGGIKEIMGGYDYDVPLGDIYKCKKCGKTIAEHIWVGHGWRNHVVSWSSEKHCNVSNCEVNHRNECNGELIVVKEGRDTDAQQKEKAKIHDMIHDIFKPKKKGSANVMD